MQLSDLLGAESPEREFEWTRNDVMLYALAVGAGQQDPGQELELTTENSSGVELTVLPTFANIITRSARVDLGVVDHTKLVHAEQSFELHDTLPLAGRAKVTARVTEIWDKGSGALLTVESRAVDAQNHKPLATTRMSLFISGAGGFGGSRGPASSWVTPTRPPDTHIRLVTRPEQALIYRLTGDRNPLHTDPQFALRGGFERPILHGMCTYGYLGRLLFQQFCDSRVSRFASMRARFLKPVYPGEELELLAWREGDSVQFTAVRGTAVVVDQGCLALRNE